jgi:hypothetical protein
MNSRKINYKSLGPECEVYVRQRSPNRTEARLIANYRRETKPSAGFLVDLDYTFPLHTLVEMDVKFPEQRFYYRSRGIVEWCGRGTDAERPYRLGIRVLGMEKLDPSGVPITPPKRKTGVHPSVKPERRDASTQVEAPPPASTVAVERPFAQSRGEHAASAGEAARSTDLKLPTAKELSELLTNLIGEEIDVNMALSSAMAAEEIAVVGDYKEETGDILTLVATDISLANWLGAALAMIPKEVARKEVEAKQLSEETRENTQEIFNINTSVLNGPNLPHVRFGALYSCMDNEQSADIRNLMDNPAGRADFIVEVPGYGMGKMAYFLAEWHAPKPAENANLSIGNAETQFQMPRPEIAKSPTTQPQPGQSDEVPQKVNEEKDSGYTTTLPTPAEIAELLTNLVGETVTVRIQAAATMTAADFAAIGDFIADDGRPLGICAMDISLSNWAAAALAMIPKNVVKKDIENGNLSEESRENIQEILNISASVFNKPSMPHLRFGSLYVPMDGNLPASIQALVDSPEERADFEVEIPGYGSGLIACIFKRLN